MPRRALLVTLLTVLTLLALPSARAGELVWSPDPPVADAPVEVTAKFDGPVDEAHLTVCLATPEHEVRSCFPAQAMRPGDGERWTATTSRGFPAGEVLGFNATARGGDGTARALPGDGADYLFVTVEADDRPVPLPAAGLLMLVGGLAALATGRRHRA